MYWLVAVLVIVTAAVAAMAFQRPVLWRMAVRNARRRPRQTLMVVAGLMIGTAIISSALVAGHSANSAVRDEVYRSLGHVDQTILAPGMPFFPDVLHDLQEDPEVSAFFDAAAPNILWAVAAEHREWFEPRVSLVGFDPVKDAAFGDFHLEHGTTDATELRRGQAVVNGALADRLGVAAGDRFRIAYTLPFDPLRPDIFEVAGVAGPMLDPGHAVDVAPGAVRITAVVAWDPRIGGVGPPVQGLQIALESPSGVVHTAEAGPDGIPLWLNVTVPLTDSLERGSWRLRVQTSPGVQAPYEGAVAVLYPVYDAMADGASDVAEAMRFVERFTQRREAEFTVAHVAIGGRGDMFRLGPAFFVRLDDAQHLLDRPGQVNLLKFSNPGGVQEGVLATQEAMRILDGALLEVQEQSGHPAVAALEAHPRKQELLEFADRAGESVTGFLLFAGSLTVITGLLLIINIFTMLAEERRTELGMARAVGMPRGNVVRVFVFEGSLYAVAAAGIGALAGLGLAWLMVGGLNLLIAGGPDGYPPIPFVVRWDAVATAFAAGGLLTFATIALASRRAARLNIVRAVRRIPEPERSATRAQVLFGIPLAGVGAVLGVAGWTMNQFSLQVFGPLVLSIGLALALRRAVPRRVLDPWLAALLAAYYAASFFLITEFDNLREANIVGPIRGVLMTLAVVVVIAHWDGGPRRLAAVLSRVRGLRAVAKPAMAYPQHRRFRTGMTLAMFSLVILSIGFFSIFGALFETDPSRQTGGFDIEGTTTLHVEDLAAYDRGLLPTGMVESHHPLVRHRTTDPDFITIEGRPVGHYGAPQHLVYGYDEAFAHAQGFQLLWRDDAYADDLEAYLDVLRRDDAIIVSYPYSTGERGEDLAHKVGDTLHMRVGPTVRAYTIVGIQEQWHFAGVFLPQGDVERLFPSAGSLHLFRLAPGVDAEEAARLLRSNYRDAGLDARASQVLVAEEQETFRQILGAMKLFLGLGLVVGVLSLGIITSRSVLERRQEIGMMRAIGYTPQQVRRVFFLEVTLTVAMGAIVGFLCSLVVSYGLWYAVVRDAQYPFVVPWGEIAVIVLIAYVVALAATAAPILRSARIPPADAVRYIE